jgi:hypothetical protein
MTEASRVTSRTGSQRRANFLAALRRQRVARLPFFFLTDNLSQPKPLPSGLGADCFDINIMRFLGSDVLDRAGLGGIVERRFRNVTVHTETVAGQSQSTTWQTSLGPLRLLVTVRDEGRTNFPTEMPIRGAEDYRRLTRLVQDAEPWLNAERLKAGHERLSAVGADGICYAPGPESPLMELVRAWAPLDRLVYDLQDRPAVVEETMAAIHDLNCRHYELLCQHTPGEVVVCWDDVNNQQVSPRMARDYWVPAIRDYAAICHSHGKVFVLHDCGKLKGLCDLFPQTGIDAVDWLSPPPTGDVTFAEAQQIFGGQITVMGVNPAPSLAFGTPDEVEASLHRWLLGVDLTHAFVLGILCPWGTPLPNAARIAKVLARDYGVPLNTAAGFPPIWEYPEAQW